MLRLYPLILFFQAPSSQHSLPVPRIPLPGGVRKKHSATGKRYCLPNSRVMIHQPLGGFQGQASDIEIHAREILYLKSRLNEIMAKHTGRPVSDVEKDTDRDNFMSAAESVNYGLVDAVLEKREVNAS